MGYIRKAQLILLCVAGMALAVCVGCREEKKFKIGISQCSSDDWRTKMNEEIRREAMFHDDVEIEIRSAGDNSARQVEDLQWFVDNGFDLLMVAPNEARTLTPVIREIQEKGIPVVIFDRNIEGDHYTARIGADDRGLGRMAARYASHLLPEGVRALEIYGLRGSTPAEDRHRGFAGETAASGGRILAGGSGMWNKEEAMDTVRALLEAYPETNVIFAHNDRMAIGASEVARSMGRGDIKIIGIDAAPEIGIRAVQDSVIDATFLYPTDGGRLIGTALDILKGRPYEKDAIMPAYNAVDRNNADILLMQDESLKAETRKLAQVKRQLDDYWTQHSSQTSLLYSSIAVVALLFGVCFLLLRTFWQRKRHQTELLFKNRELQEQRDHEMELNARLQEAVQSKLAFFTNVSHDLRTPLTLIAEPVAQLAQARNLTPRQETLMKIAHKNVLILQRLINQILDFRKYESGKLDLKTQPLDLAQAVAEWTESFNQLARKRHMELRLEIQPGDYKTEADPGKIERVFFNLLSNAFKYTPDNGAVTVSLVAGDNDFTLKVSDTGEGISEEDLGKIFDRFYQVDRVHPKGSGIGLSLAKAFVEMHGGTVSVESTPGKGTEFTVTVPRRIPATEAEPAPVAKTISGADTEEELAPVEAVTDMGGDRPLLLVIDDNRDIQKLVGQLMGDKYNVIGASNGKEGLAKAVKYVPDLIVCDVMMPVMDGLECCRALKSEVSTSHIPVLMLTACSLDEQRVQGYGSGADGYLSKPFGDAVLHARCDNLVENRRRIRDVWQHRLPGAKPTEAAKPEKPDVAKTGPGSLAEIDSEFYDRFLAAFDREMGNPDLSVDSLAAQLGLGRSQFYRKIKALTNFSPVELMKRLRLSKARHMLLTTEKSISEIGYDTGFSTPAYFTKCFRETYGQTPTEERAALRGKK